MTANSFSSAQSGDAAFYRVGGSLPVDAPSYVERQCDRDYFQKLSQGEYCYVFNCRQMGKSSLRVRVTQKLAAAGVACALIDPQKIGLEVTGAQWYASAMRSIVVDLGLDDRFSLKSWLRERGHLAPVDWFGEFMETVVLREVPGPIVIFVEEIDQLLSLPFGMGDFFGLVRSWFEERASKPAFRRLTVSFLGVATPMDLINSSFPFNVATGVEMEGFTVAEAEPLGAGLRLSDPQPYVAALVRWSGGQPFLLQKLLSLVATELESGPIPPDREAWLGELIQTRVIQNWEAQDVPLHLGTIRERVLRIEEKQRGLVLGLYQRVLEQGQVEADGSEEQAKLALTNLVVRQGGFLRSRNPIYRAVFDLAWVQRLLGELRPGFYREALRAWRESGEQEGFLLRGEALRQAEDWAAGKRLSEEDEGFLRLSREIELREMQQRLSVEEEAKIILQSAWDKAVRLGGTAAIIGGIALVTAVVAVPMSFRANQSLESAKEDLEQVEHKLEKAEAEIQRKQLLQKQLKQDFRTLTSQYTQAITLAPDNSSFYVARGLVFQGQGDLESAIRDYTQALELDPDVATAYYFRAMAYDEQGNVELAMEDYQKAISLNPQYADPQYAIDAPDPACT
ncbi:MAG: AAA-like domain-containing protein, partial [Prochlorothrix sp.]